MRCHGDFLEWAGVCGAGGGGAGLVGDCADAGATEAAAKGELADCGGDDSDGRAGVDHYGQTRQCLCGMFSRVRV